MKTTEKSPSAPTVESILAENRRRNASDRFDPLSGYHAGGKRRKISVDGLEPAVQYIPRQMLGEPLVKLLVQEGSVDSYLRHLGTAPTDTTRRETIMQWNRLRITHDFPFWAAWLVRIKSKTGDITPFILNAPQRRLIEAFERQRCSGRPIRLVLLKARQWGGSTATQLYMSWIQLVHRRGWNSLIVGHQSASAAEVNNMFELMLENYPAELMYAPGETVVARDTRLTNLHGTTSTRVLAARNAKIKLGTAERPNSVRGGDSSMVHCTEVAFWKRTEGRTPVQMMKAATSGVLYRPLTMIVYESSANGVGNFFHSEYEAAKNGMSQFAALFVPWFEIEQYRLPFTPGNVPPAAMSGLVPRFATARELAAWMLGNRMVSDPLSERTVDGEYIWRMWEQGATLEAINWYLSERTKYIDQADMASEFPGNDIEAFAHSGARVFSLDRLEMLRRECRAPSATGDIEGRSVSGAQALEDLRFESSAGGRLRIWAYPAHSDSPATIRDRYVVTVDIGGRSPKADWSVIWVADRAPLLCGQPVETVAQWRGHTDMDLLAWKAAQIARFYNNALLVIESNTLETSEADRFVDGDQAPYILRLIRDVYPNLYARANGKLGFHTNVATKPMVISTLVQTVRDGMLLEREAACIDEFACYERRSDGSFGAILGHHDDMLMTRAIGMYVASVELPVTPPIGLRRSSNWLLAISN